MNEASNKRPFESIGYGARPSESPPSSSSQVRERVQVPPSAAPVSPPPLSNKPSLERSLQRFAQRYCVPDREMQLVRLTVAGVPRSRCPALMDVSENTCKTLARRLLQRCGARNLADLARMVLLGELEGGGRF